MSYLQRHREFDYIQMRWLERTTGRPAHEWDLYIVKELIDNALDVDERTSPSGRLQIRVDIRYSLYGAVDISVSNGSLFPIDQLPRLLDFRAYTSSKGLYNTPTRGRQGNALKTILGIPYALRQYHVGDYFQVRKPLAIETGEYEAVMSLDIDERQQSINLSEIRPKRLAERADRTRVRVGIDYFGQERPRTLSDLKDFSRQFALLNPHASFVWDVAIREQKEAWRFESDLEWKGRFVGSAPVEWFEYAQLRELLLSLEREFGQDTPLIEIVSGFAGFSAAEDPDGRLARQVCQQAGFLTIGDINLERDHVNTLRNRLLPSLKRLGARVPAERLGGVGETHLVGGVTRCFSLEGTPLYRRVVAEIQDEAEHPFVLELLIARLAAGQKRVIWTGMNHSPTYEDPFYARRLFPPDLSEGVFGLDRFLDHYGHTSAQPVLLIMHLIAPNPAYQDFSKTMIEARPYRDRLATTLHEMLTEFVAVGSTAVKDLSVMVATVVPEAVRWLSPDGRQPYAPQQLRRVVLRLVEQKLVAEYGAAEAEAWFAQPGSEGRLQTYIDTYARAHPENLPNLIQREVGGLCVPVHPDRHAVVQLSELNVELLEDRSVNKLLVIDSPEIEPFILASGLLSRFDMALMRLENPMETSLRSILRRTRQAGLPLVVLHDASAEGCRLTGNIRSWLRGWGMEDLPVHDLGLTPAQAHRLGLAAEPGGGSGTSERATLIEAVGVDDADFFLQPRNRVSLFSFGSAQLRVWLAERMLELGLNLKFLPERRRLQEGALTEARKRIGESVMARFQEDVGAGLIVDRIVQLLQAGLKLEGVASEVKRALEAEPRQSWRSACSAVVSAQCTEVLNTFRLEVEEAVAAEVEMMSRQKYRRM